MADDKFKIWYNGEWYYINSDSELTNEAFEIVLEDNDTYTLDEKIEDLKFDLAECIELEEYSKCAIIRDKINQLKIYNEFD